MKRLRAKIREIQPIPGVPEILRELNARGLRLGIVTSNSEEKRRHLPENHDIEFFEFVRSSSRLLGKAREIRQVMKAESSDRRTRFFVGDETRDIEACRRVNIRCARRDVGLQLPPLARGAGAAIRPRPPRRIAAGLVEG